MWFGIWNDVRHNRSSHLDQPVDISHGMETNIGIDEGLILVVLPIVEHDDPQITALHRPHAGDKGRDLLIARKRVYDEDARSRDERMSEVVERQHPHIGETRVGQKPRHQLLARLLIVEDDDRRSHRESSL